MGRVKAWEDTLVIPTYEVGPVDRNPPILMGRRNPIHPGGSIIYPYPMMENLANRRQEREWKVIYLENDYLRITVAPPLGGHVLAVWDKVAGAEAIYHNHTLKYARIGIRGAWVSGGIEWNFPNGHTVTSASPVDSAIRENGDGSITVLVGDIERVSRMRWSVGITLREDRAAFETEMRLFNRTAFPNRYWFWANSAAPQSKGLQFVSTASRVMSLKGPWSFPVQDGVDVSWDRNHAEAQDMFCLNPREEFVGWYNHDLERGMMNVADRSEARGTKFYTWGNSDDGDIWVERLTDGDGQYAEMQSGRFPTMAIWEILPPGTLETWREVWYPVRRIGPPCFANAEVAFSLARPAGASGRLRLALQANSPHPQARVAVRAGGRVLWSERVQLDPQAPCILELTVPPEQAAGAHLAVTAADGRPLAAAALAPLLDPATAASPEVKGYMRVDPSREPSSAEACRLNGLDQEKLGNTTQAREQYEQALRHDPGYGPALAALGILELRDGRTDAAREYLERILRRDPQDEAARFYLGVQHLMEERFAAAIGELRLLMRSKAYRTAAATLLGGLYLGQGEPGRAREQLGKAAGEQPDAEVLLACALRREGRAEEAGERLAAILQRDPLHLTALAEAVFLAAGDSGASREAGERLQRVLRGETQSYLELAVEYGRFGMYREAIDILTLYADGGSRPAHPLVHYYLGYYTEKLAGDGAAVPEAAARDAAAHFRAGREAPPDLVFPHRLESERVLRRALERDPADRRAAYYLGNLLCARNRPREAMQLWEQAARGEAAFSVAHRNLGRAYWKLDGDAQRAVREYAAALEADPGDYKLYFELDRIYAARGMEPERDRLIASIPAGLRDNDVLAERIALRHVDRGEFEAALEVLRRTWFFPWEVYKGVRLLLVDANIGLGVRRLQEGDPAGAVECFRAACAYPRNIGVGEPQRKANAEALYRIGLALERAGDTARARESWEAAAAEPHPEPGALVYYGACALQKLGCDAEARRALEGLAAYARGGLERGGGVAAGPGTTAAAPAAAAELHYLLGLALKGLGRETEARASFEACRRLDRTHRRSRWELDGLTAA